MLELICKKCVCLSIANTILDNLFLLQSSKQTFQKLNKNKFSQKKHNNEFVILTK